MNLRALVNGVTSQINPNTPVTIQASTGYTTGAGLKQVPVYAAPVSGPAQIQALDSDELRNVDSQNLQGDIRAIYLRGPLHGVIRPDGKGGDLITVASGVHAGVWLPFKILETWPDWTKAAIVKQGGV